MERAPVFPNYMQVPRHLPIALWRVIQGFILLAALGLCYVLLTHPETGLLLLWGISVPLLPLVFFFSPGLWRNFCPLAMSNQLPQSPGEKKNTSGNLEVRVPHPKGYGKRIHPIERGCVFGEQSFLDGRPRSADVVSVTDGELLVLSLDAFQTLAGWEPKLGMQILLDLGRILSMRLRWMAQLLPK